MNKQVGMGMALAIAILIPTCVRADEIQIPFPIYAEDFKHDMKCAGYDLYGNRESIGFVEDKGGEFKVYTYHHASVDLMDMITKYTWKNIRR